MNSRLSLSPAACPTTFHAISFRSRCRFPNLPTRNPIPPSIPAVPQTPCLILSGRTSSRTAGKHSRGSRPLSPFVLFGKLLQDGRSKLRAFSPHPQSISPSAPSSAHLFSPLNSRLLAVPRSSRTFRLHNLPPLFRPNAVQYGPNPHLDPFPHHLPSHSLNSPSRLLLIIPTGKLLTISLTFSFTPSLSPALAA